jgi:hypothetical protein
MSEAEQAALLGAFEHFEHEDMRGTRTLSGQRDRTV